MEKEQKIYYIMDLKGDWIATFRYSGDAIGYCHSKGIQTSSIVIKEICNCKDKEDVSCDR